LRYGDEFVLLARGEIVLQGKIDRLIGIGKRYGMERNVDKATIRTTEYDRSNKTEECVLFQPFVFLGGIITREIEPRISVIKAAFNNNKAVFPCKLT